MEEPSVDVEALLSGDEGAWRVLMRSLTSSLVGYASTITGDSFEAQDIVQQVFIRLYQKRSKVDWSRGSIRGLSFRIDPRHDAGFQGVEWQ